MSIQEDEKHTLWLGNTQGLIKFSPSTYKSQCYTYDDGLQSNTFTEASAKCKDGTLIFGGINGINYFNPSEIFTHSYSSSIVFSDFRVNNTSIKPGDLYKKTVILDSTINLKTKIKLNYLQNDFQIEFVGIPFDNIQRNKFRYKLVGYEDEWVYVTNKNRFASYTNISAGEYKFVIESTNDDGVWGDVSKTLKISVSPPPWFSVWAFLLYFIAVLSAIIYIFRSLRNHQILQHRIELDRIQLEQEDRAHESELMFFTDIAHEFKTPLSLIVGPVNDLIGKGEIDETQHFRFNVISRNVNRMMFLVNQLLDFRTMSKGKYSLQVVNADLSAFVKHVSDAFLWESTQDKIHYNINVPESFSCYFDKDIVEKVLYNMLSNAFKYTKVNGIIDIDLKDIRKNNNQYANIIIKDNGPGIPDEYKSKVFERFFHSSTRGASGIGLHLSEQMAKEHHGEISVTDSNYGGAEFSLMIPVSKDNYNESEIILQQNQDGEEWASLEITALAEQSVEDALSEKEHVLIVEDNLDLRKYLAASLSSYYVISEARNGIEGLEMADKIQPSLIISDIMMPEMDGIEMLKSLKSNINLSHIPVILLTAKTDVEYQEIGLEAGAIDYVCKPFNTDLLFKKIKNVITFQATLKDRILNGNKFMNLKNHFTSYDQKLIEKLTIIIEENMENVDLKVDFIAKQLGMSRMQLYRKIKVLTGETTTSFINMIKIRHAKNLFDQNCDRVQEAMDAVGISSNSYFNKIFKLYFGETPSNYINKIKSKNIKPLSSLKHT